MLIVKAVLSKVEFPVGGVGGIGGFGRIMLSILVLNEMRIMIRIWL